MNLDKEKRKTIITIKVSPKDIPSVIKNNTKNKTKHDILICIMLVKNC